jgi:enoyl-CoA hydratase/carnithine racemase
MVVGGADVDAAQAERWGLVNRALPIDELRPVVEALARRVAGFPRESVVAAKQAVDAALGNPRDGLMAEADLFNQAWSTGPGKGLIERFLALGGQTAAGEMDLPALYDKLKD